MNHPVFVSTRSLMVYFGSWILLAWIHFFILYYFLDFPWRIAAVDSLSFNLLFCLLGIAMWYVIRYNIPDRNSQNNVWFNLLTSFLLIMLLWFGLSYGLLSMTFSEITAYIDFLNDSIPYRLVSGLLIFTLIGMGYFLLIYYNNLQAKMQVESRLSSLLKESELNMLKSQINPHFLFNSLNSVSSLTITDPDKAREMVIKLSDFLRYTVSTNTTSLTSLEKELNNIRLYLDIEKVRFGERLVYNFQVEEGCLSLEIPVMILQPLFENAIKHGVYESTETVNIHLACYRSACCLELRITNDFDPTAPRRKGAGLGLKNIRERLRLLYQNDNLIQTYREGNQYFANLSIPVQIPEKS